MFNSGSLVRTGTDAGSASGGGSGHPFGMQIQAGKGAGSGQDAGGQDRAGAAGSFSRQEWDHDDDSGAAAAGRADERNDHDDADTARSRGARSSTLGTDGFRGAATGQRDHPGGHDADHPDRSAHQRKNQPRGRHVYRRVGGTGAGRRQQRAAAEGCVGGWRGGCVASARTLQRQIAAGVAVDFADAEWDAVSADDAGPVRKARRARADVRRP